MRKIIFSAFQGKTRRSAWRFATPHRPEAGLRISSFEIKPGEMVAITGGAVVGKTTLLRMMAGLHPPTFGSVLVAIMDLRQIDPAEWRSQMAFLPETANFLLRQPGSNIRLPALMRLTPMSCGL